MNDKTMLELAPCPFCGNAAEFKTKRRGFLYPHYVGCTVCDASIGGTAYKNDEFNASCWNTRATLGQTLPPKTGA